MKIKGKYNYVTFPSWFNGLFSSKHLNKTTVWYAFMDDAWSVENWDPPIIYIKSIIFPKIMGIKVRAMNRSIIKGK